MKVLGYIESLRGWQCDNGFILNLPATTTEADVLVEAERVEKVRNTPPAIELPPTMDELLDLAITEYVANGGKPETVADVAVAKMEAATASAYLDQKAVDVKPEPKPGEKPAVHIRRDEPAVHIRRDEKLALCEYFLGPYTWAFTDQKQAQQEIDARGVVEICPKCLEVGVK